MSRLAILAALTLAGCGDDAAPPRIEVAQPWARETAPGQSSAAVYLTVRNRGGRDQLTAAATSAAASATIHGTDYSGGIARMRALPEGVAIPEGGTLELRPGGTHIMLAGLKTGLQAGATVPLKLSFQSAGSRNIQVRVVRAGEAGPHQGH